MDNPNCPKCGREASWVEKYHQYYCFTCGNKFYVPLPSPPPDWKPKPDWEKRTGILRVSILIIPSFILVGLAIINIFSPLGEGVLINGGLLLIICFIFVMVVVVAKAEDDKEQEERERHRELIATLKRK